MDLGSYAGVDDGFFCRWHGGEETRSSSSFGEHEDCDLVEGSGLPAPGLAAEKVIKSGEGYPVEMAIKMSRYHRRRSCHRGPELQLLAH
jgi:hypothetical protein